MKQVFLGVGLAVVYLVTQGANTSAEAKGNDVIYSAYSFTEHNELPHAKNFSVSFANDVNIKAKRNFSRTFEDVTTEQWYTMKDGYLASFKKNDIRTEVYYNNKGTWLYNLLTYQEAQLPSAVRDQVKSANYDYTIFMAFEYQFFDGPVYIVKMKNATTYKTVMIFNDEMQVIEKFNNS